MNLKNWQKTPKNHGVKVRIVVTSGEKVMTKWENLKTLGQITFHFLIWVVSRVESHHAVYLLYGSCTFLSVCVLGQ